ncbi:hypothetical protein H310_11993 [Aphanomyces invadans]|uniref:Potassium channel tetramerisation-type BTB domain-containing protein n=1 Tax=Aphanomyces invadans TaxID=157072 RepID=A0A024TJN8_9STRA|nr:hypothetical protein H310_11993 [Aphanomyces invadans]ETV94350.1 hypothetical protein H310_11993 [Aphanomyces invadans]|eukprot:XP_008877112.1 hypothetical protein H310_11993 [Aphanomyces invadans]
MCVTCKISSMSAATDPNSMLTTNAVATLYMNPAARTFHPLLQIIHAKEIQDKTSHHCVVVLSDGEHCISGLVPLGAVIATNCARDMHTCCVVQLDAFNPKIVAGNLILIVDGLTHVACAAGRIGLPHPTFVNIAPPSMSALLQAQLDLLVFKETQHTAFLESVRRNARAATTLITLNIGGQRFQTAAANLLRHTPSYFTMLLADSSGPPPPDHEYFIDVDPIHFDRVMVHLRTGDPLSYDGLSLWETLQLRKTVRFLGLEPHCTSMDVFMEHMASLKATDSPPLPPSSAA